MGFVRNQYYGSIRGVSNTIPISTPVTAMAPASFHSSGIISAASLNMNKPNNETPVNPPVEPVTSLAKLDHDKLSLVCYISIFL